jgi:hypothetical protein
MNRRRHGLFLPVDVNFMDDPLIDAVGEQAAWLYLAMCLRSKSLLSDGVLTERQVEKLGIAQWRKRLEALLSTADPANPSKALVVRLDDGRLWIMQWQLHNESAVQVAERQKKDRDRKESERKASQLLRGLRTESSHQVEKSREEHSRDADNASDAA